MLNFRSLGPLVFLGNNPVNNRINPVTLLTGLPQGGLGRRPRGRSPLGGKAPRGRSMGWAEGPLTVPRPKPKLPPLGRRLEVLAGVRGVTRHVYVVPSESSHVEYP